MWNKMRPRLWPLFLVLFITAAILAACDSSTSKSPATGSAPTTATTDKSAQASAPGTAPAKTDQPAPAAGQTKTDQPSTPPAPAAAKTDQAPSTPPVNKPAAMVDGSSIPTAEFDMEFGRLQQEYTEKNLRQPDADQLKELKKLAIDHLIGRELLYLDSKNKGVKIEDAELDARIKSLQTQFPSPEEYKQALTQMNMTETQLRDDFRRALSVERWITKEFLEKITVTDQESQAYYDQHPEFFKSPEAVRASHILILAGAEATEADKKAAREKIDKVKQRIAAGEDFAGLAKELSQCPSREKGGDLGFFRRGQMVKPFEEVAFKLEPNQVSDVVETTFGYHIIKGVERRPAGQTPLAEVQPKIKEYLKNEKAGQKLNVYVAGLREKAKIEIFVLDK